MMLTANYNYFVCSFLRDGINNILKPSIQMYFPIKLSSTIVYMYSLSDPLNVDMITTYKLDMAVASHVASCTQKGLQILATAPRRLNILINYASNKIYKNRCLRKNNLVSLLLSRFLFWHITYIHE